MGDTTKSWNYLRTRCEDLELLRCLIRPRLRHEKHRSFLLCRIDLLNRTDPDEEVKNVEYMMQSAFLPSLAKRRSGRSTSSQQLVELVERVALEED